MRVFGYIMVTIATSLFCSNIGFYFYVILPMISTPPSLFFMWNAFFGVAVGFNLLYNYYQTVRTDPGQAPKEWLDALENTDELKSQTTTVKGKTFSKYCNRCRQAKPPRAHHCHICDKCVCRMDHHCPWVNNCVGYKNHRYFILFLFYLWVGAVYLGAMLALGSFDIITFNAEIYEEWHTWVTFIMVLCASISITMTGFLGWHLYLVATNQTTIEFQFNKFRMLTERGTGRVAINEFDIGLRNNFDQIFSFGKASLLWIFVPTVRELPLNGADYPTLSTLRYNNKSVDQIV
jgi:hypothetical protein